MSDTPLKEVLVEAVEESQQPDDGPQEQPETPQESEVEQFAEKGELRGKTPEELEEIHKNWQRAYTEKRQKETQELKQLREELEKVRSAQAQTPTTDQVPQIRQEMGQAQKDLQLGRMSVEEYTLYMRQLMAEEARQIAREEYETISTQKQEESYQEQAYQEFLASDERGRLDSNSPEADEALIRLVQDHLAVELDKFISQNGTSKGFPTTKIAKEKIAEYDARLDEIIKNRTKQSTQLAQARAAKAQKSSTRGTNANSAPLGGSSIRDILSQAVDESAS